MAYSTIVSPNNLVNLISDVDGEVYAAETTSNNTSLIIDNGTATSSTATVRNNVAYSSHTVQVKADNITGYSLTITGPSNLTNGSTTIGGANGKTGTQLASADTGWGYGWNTTGTTNANIVYNSFPTTNNGTVTLESSNSVGSIDFTKKLVFAAKFSQDAVEGHYRANVKLNLTVTPKNLTSTYSVSYDKNGGTGGPASVNSGAITDSSYYYTIPTTTPTRAGFEFLGWNNNNSTTAVHYNPGDSITLTTASPSVTLYAVWKLVSLEGITTMQQMTGELCKNSTVGASNTVTDSRDGKSYTIRKLTDGKCWMVDNLKLNLSAVTLTPSDSDVNADYPKGTATNITTASNWISSGSAVAWTAQWTEQVAVSGYYPGDKKGYQSSYGYYYSWCAATATTSGSSGTCRNYRSGDAPSSICPKGWKLPKGDSDNGDFQILYNKYTTSTWTTVNNTSGKWFGAASATAGGAFFPAAGYVNSSGLGSPGSSGTYWSRTVTNGGDYGLYFLFNSGGSVISAQTQNKASGSSVRCIAYSS